MCTNDLTVESTTKGKGGKTQTPPPLPKQREHNESIWKQLSHPKEVVAAVQLLTNNPLQSNLTKDEKDEDLLFCDYILGSVARPYAAAIRQLPRSTLVNVTILHHALRALDTIEDDMTAFETNEIKIGYLNTFVKLALGDNPNWNLEGVGLGDEALLLQEWPKCHRVFRKLPPKAQEIIRDITHRMAVGMSEFIEEANFKGPDDIDQYNQYCHWVAGLVAEGLVRLFALDGLENPSLAKELKLADHVGFFLQKCNIIRDFLEDYNDQRVFWPHSVVNKYVPGMSHLADLKAPIEPKVQCLNHLVTDALKEVPHILGFLSKLECMETHRFFALLLSGAMATLTQCYNNPNLFTGKVRIRKGLACRLALAANDRDAVQGFFGMFAAQIQQIASTNGRDKKDPSWMQTVRVCNEIAKATLPAKMRTQVVQQRQWRGMCYIAFIVLMMLVLASFVGGDPLGERPLLVQKALNRTLVVAALGLGVYVSKPSPV